MDRMIYNAMAGAKAAMHRQEVLSTNLANASTTGFRAELLAASAHAQRVPFPTDAAHSSRARMNRAWLARAPASPAGPCADDVAGASC